MEALSLASSYAAQLWFLCCNANWAQKQGHMLLGMAWVPRGTPNRFITDAEALLPSSCVEVHVGRAVGVLPLHCPQGNWVSVKTCSENPTTRSPAEGLVYFSPASYFYELLQKNLEHI
jgi:hypothetical protein